MENFILFSIMAVPIYIPSNNGDSNGKKSAMQETQVQSLDREDPKKSMATHSSVLSWRIPWTEEPGGLQSIWSQGARHD